MKRHIMTYILIALLSVSAVLCGIQLRNAITSDYIRKDFTVQKIYTVHGFVDKHFVTVQCIDGEALIQPDNKIETIRTYETGETVALWYSPSSNEINQHFMIQTGLYTIGAAVCVLCILFNIGSLRKKTHDET